MDKMSRHAQLRSDQRSVPVEHIELAIAWGHEIHQRGGCVAYHLGFRDIAAARAQGVRLPERAEGVAVVLAADGTIVTVLRSHDRRRLTGGRDVGRPHRRAGGAW